MNVSDFKSKERIIDSPMNYYFAPMEGITNYRFRNIHHDCFPGVDRYYSPFLSPTKETLMTAKERRDIAPENNRGMTLIPQILVKNPELMVTIAKYLYEEMGYELINLNLGCPSGTVVAKGKGAGMLRDRDELDRFFFEVLEGLRATPIRLSIKTRIGLDDPSEFDALMDVYSRYPFEELIIHPRTRKELYKGDVHEDAYAIAREKLTQANQSTKLCLNGNLLDISSTKRLLAAECSKEAPFALMFGRGLVANPALIRQLQGGADLSLEEFIHFHDLLLQETISIMSGDRNILFRMKEYWYYFAKLFQPADKCVKEVRKCNTLLQYQAVVAGIFAGQKYLFTTSEIDF